MSEDLVCPICGAPVSIIGGTDWYNRNEFFIECRNKFCLAIGDTDRDECIRRWKDIPCAFVWTKTPPIKEGWYWLRYRGEMKIHNIPRLVHVYFDEKTNVFQCTEGRNTGGVAERGHPDHITEWCYVPYPKSVS